MANAASVSATGNAEIDGLLSGVKWSGTISYSFPTSASLYPSPYSSSNEPSSPSFATAPVQMQTAINYAVALIQSYTNASITYNGSGSADIMVAQSSASNPTSKAYYPSSSAAGGDVWFGIGYDYTQAKLGNYYFVTALHELGHAFGLKHSQETGGPANVAVPSAHDDSEYTVMSYRSYVGASVSGGYTNEAYGYSQTYMANDILALQTMYGANYATQSSNTVYTWNPTTGQEFINGVGQLADGGGVGGSANRIYETIWDGGGVDTYDLSNYTTNLSINLNPGASSVFSSTQLAYLGNGNYAAGNVYNAYLYNGDTRSYIDNATGGSGNDTIIGNAIANVLNGGSGNDTITGGGGNDTIIGGAGTDTAVYSGNRANYAISYNSSTQTFTLIDQRSGSPDGTDTATGIEYFQFADGTVASAVLSAGVIESIGTTALVFNGGNYSLNPTAGGTGPVLKNGGAPVLVGNYGAWSPFAAEQVAGGGYDVAWKNATTGYFSVWSVDSNANFVSTLTPEVPASDARLKALEEAFHQDLNGDGIISSSSAVIENTGVTSLVQVGANFQLLDIATGVGPTLKNGGAAIIAGNYGSWSPIAAEQVSGGYDVAWKNASTGYFSIWSTDTNGNFVSTLTAEIPGSNPALKSFEAIFQQDLNGDGAISSASLTIEHSGSTSLVQIGSNYHLNNNTTGTGPVLKNGGLAVLAGNYGAWSPVAAEQVSGGNYDVAWKNSSTGNFSIWSTDSNGNFLGTLTAEVSGQDASVKSFEVIFQQDLNGDGIISSSSTTIEQAGSTSLVQIGANYYLNSLATGTGPTLKNGGAVVLAGNYGAWSPVAAEQVGGGGYDVAWKNASTGYFSVWSTDSNGNFTATITPEVPGSSSSLKALEVTFQQDLNGDGAVGASPIAAASENFDFKFGRHSSFDDATESSFDPMPEPASSQSGHVITADVADSAMIGILNVLLHHESGFLLA